MNKTYRTLTSLSQADIDRLRSRFWSYVPIPLTVEGLPDSSQPWLWTGCTDNLGYGLIKVKGVTMYAHRVSFVLHYGFLPEVVRHKEPIPQDVNPYRLVSGTHQDNVADRQRDGNTARGERNGRARLNESDVQTIRSRLDRGATKGELARQYSVDHKTITLVGARSTWKHVT